MKNSFKTLLIIFFITLVSGGLLSLYKSDFYQNKLTASTYEFDDQNTSIKTTLINAKNIKFEDRLTIQNKNQLSVTKKINYITNSTEEFNINVRFIDDTDCTDFIDINVDYKLSQMTFSILSDFDKQIRINIKNNEIEALFSIDYYKTVKTLSFKNDDIIIYPTDNYTLTHSNNIICFDNMFKKTYSKFSIDKQNVISFEGDIIIEDENILNTNDFVKSILQKELKEHFKEKLKNFYNLSSAEEIWNLSDNVIWKEFLKSYTKREYNLFYVKLTGKFYADGKLLYENITTNEEVYFNSAIFEYFYVEHFD